MRKIISNCPEECCPGFFERKNQQQTQHKWAECIKEGIQKFNGVQMEPGKFGYGIYYRIFTAIIMNQGVCEYIAGNRGKEINNHAGIASALQ